MSNLAEKWDSLQTEHPRDRELIAKHKAKTTSPNKDIDDAIKTMMNRIKGKGDESTPPDIAVKIINTAIAWEKVKHHINDAEQTFDPDSI